MPKTKKILTKTLYSYVKPENNTWIRANYRKLGYSSYSQFVDAIISTIREKKLSNIVRGNFTRNTSGGNGGGRAA